MYVGVILDEAKELHAETSVPHVCGGVILLLHCLNIKLDSVPHVNGGDYLEKLKK